MKMRIEDTLRPSFELHRDELAIIDGEIAMTYRQLDERSNRIAEALVAAGLQREDRVCLLLPKSADGIAVVLGVLKAGGVYIPLDCASPATRLSLMVRICAPCWIVTDSAHLSLAAGTLGVAEGAPIYGMFQLHAPFAFTSENIARGTSPSQGTEVDKSILRDLAYILFTSGSTGQPKGVPIPHRNVVEYVSWANNHFRVKPTDRISSHAPLHFDMSVWDIFGTLAAGAKLYLVPPKVSLTPTLTADFIKRYGLTQWYSVPSVLVAMASRDVLKQDHFPKLERVIWGGEAFPVRALQYWMERLPRAVFTNVYGPTEATINCTYYTVTRIPADTSSKVPIGFPIPGRTLNILDENGREVPPGQIGNLYTGGEGLSPGYWRDPAKTADSFFEIPVGSGQRWYRTGDLAHVDDDGVYHFHGRSDQQIKVRGCRVELDEVATALTRLPQLEESAVVAVPVQGFEGMRICAAYVTVQGKNCSAAELKEALASLLPPYMLPRQWVGLERMPKNVNGKIDLVRLKAMFADD